MNDKYLQIAKQAAIKAGKMVRERFYLDREVLEYSDSELHLKVDIDSEEIIMQDIRDNFPEHDILAEESGGNDDANNYLWIIDPIDGTSNYYCYNPFFCISIALARENELILGVVYNPITNEMFSASKNGGLYINEKKFVHHKKPSITTSIFGGYHSQDRCDNLYGYGLNSSTHHNKLEMASAELELSYVACGRINTYMLNHGRIWDIAAGILLVRESGGQVTDWSGEEWEYGGKEVLASNDKILHAEILKNIGRE